MSEELLVIHCSPTLAGIKTGNTFTCRVDSADELRREIAHWNKRLSSKGLRIIPMCRKNGRAVIYVYRPARLSGDLKNERACRLLRDRGYGTHSPELCVAQLSRRMKEMSEFPHELGLFLGYPPEDVEGFIDNNARNSKLTGSWKVYGDEKAAKKTFDGYKKCTREYCRSYKMGKTVEWLTVAERS